MIGNVVNDQYMVETISKVDPFDKSSIMNIALIGEEIIPGIKGHILRTAYYTQLIVNKLYSLKMYPEIVTEDYKEMLPLAVALHDVGKLKISSAILDSRKKLDSYEFEEMKKHITYGDGIIRTAFDKSNNKEFMRLVNEVVLYHHEKWDGSGYLAGLKGDDIPLSARIAAIADVFDALTSKRTYKDAFPYEFSIDYIKKEKGKHFDPKLLDIFLCEDIQKKIVKVLSPQ